MKRKIVYVKSHGPLSFSKTAQIGWEDVWLRVHSGRRCLKLGPCLVSREHLRSDIAIAEKIGKDPDAGTRELHAKEAIELRALLENLDAKGFVVDQEPRSLRRGSEPGRDYALANVYTRSAWINRDEAERMIGSYLAELGMHNCNFKWKSSRFLAWPTTLDADMIA
jgi:hypothetical protein